MDQDEYKRHLKRLRQQSSERGYFTLVLDLLGQGPSEEERRVLEDSLVAYSDIDPDRAAEYWEPFLSSADVFQREVTARQLAALIQRYDCPLAYRFLAEFFGHEPTRDRLDDILQERMLRLFPGYDGPL